MEPKEATLERRSWALLVTVGFLPFLVKAVSYAALGSFVPLVVFAVFAGWVAYGFRRGPRPQMLAVRAWALALILWGLARLAVMALFLWTSVSEAHVESQLTAGYVALSVVHVVLGLFLFRHSRKAAGA